MKKIFVSCVLSFSFIYSAFAATSALTAFEENCTTRCTAINDKGCKLLTCGWNSDGGVWCTYPSGKCSEMEISVEEGAS